MKMTLKRAIEVLTVLLARTADCRCGNYEFTREEVQAMQFILDNASQIEIE